MAIPAAAIGYYAYTHPESYKDPAGYFGNMAQSGAKKLGAISNYQATAPGIQKQDIIGQINAQAAQQQGLYGQEQGLAQALMRQSQGYGPNPAQIQLQQATDRNLKQGAGMIASQKGINPALAARQIAENNAAVQQQAAGQGALMGAQQQLQAQGQLGGLYGQMGGQNLQGLSTYENAQAAQNNAINTGELGAAQINAATASNNAKIMAGGYGGLLQGAGSAAGMAAMSDGGHVPGHAMRMGDHEENDTVPAMLSPGEIVVPRSHAGSAEKAKEFIDHLKGTKGSDSKGYGKVLEANRKLKQRIKELEAKMGKRA